MSRADTVTKLPLDEWARIMRVNPLHFAGVNIAEFQVSVVSGQAWFQHAWQDNDRVSREEVAEAIRSAEDDIEALLGFKLLPDWTQDERQPTTRPFRPETVNLNDRDVRGRWQHIRPDWGHFLSGGIRSKEVIEAAAAITWSSTKSPSTYEDTGTVTVNTTVTDPEEVRLYYAGKSADDSWEIRPINVAIAGGVATITFARELVITEALMEAMTPGASSGMFADGVNDTHFESTVDVYRVYNDPQQQVTLLWEPHVAVTDVEAGAYDVQTGLLAMHGDPRHPAVTYRPATWNPTTLQFTYAAYLRGYQPDLVRLWYYSGYQDRDLATPRVTMDRRLARAVAQVAASRLSRDDCAGYDFTYWRQDLAADAADGLRRRGVTKDQLSNPLGTKQGEVTAYRAVRPLAVGQSVSA